MTEKDALYPIREISRLTGVSPITLRAWERRYALIEPVRTDTGHRLYTQAHIDFINQAVELTKQGIPISKVKTVLDEREDAKMAARVGVDIDYQNEILVACKQLNLAEVELLLEQAFVNLLQQQVYSLVVNISLALQDEDYEVLVVWQSVVNPILACRTYQGRKSLKQLPNKKAYIIADNAQSSDLTQLLANQAVQAGYNPIMGGVQTVAEAEKIIQAMTTLHCEVLAISAINLNAKSLKQWQTWAKQHKSIEVVLVCSESSADGHEQSLNFKQVSFLDLNYFA